MFINSTASHPHLATHVLLSRTAKDLVGSIDICWPDCIVDDSIWTVSSRSAGKQSNNGCMSMKGGIVKGSIVPPVRCIDIGSSEDQSRSNGNMTSLSSLVKGRLTKLVGHVDQQSALVRHNLGVVHKCFHDTTVTVLGSQHQRSTAVAVLCRQISASSQSAANCTTVSQLNSTGTNL